MGKSSSRKSPCVMYYTLYIMDPQQKHINTFICAYTNLTNQKITKHALYSSSLERFLLSEICSPELVPGLFHRLGAPAADIRADMFQPLALWPMVHVFVYSIPSSHPLM